VQVIDAGQARRTTRQQFQRARDFDGFRTADRLGAVVVGADLATLVTLLVVQGFTFTLTGPIGDLGAVWRVQLPSASARCCTVSLCCQS
jgi:imidazolonepropionase-like amidohydrolase